MSSKIERARGAVIEFFSSREPAGRVFHWSPSRTTGRDFRLHDVVEDIQGKLVYTVPKGRHALLDAIYLGLSKMRQARYAKKAMLIIPMAATTTAATRRRNPVDGEEADILNFMRLESTIISSFSNGRRTALGRHVASALSIGLMVGRQSLR